MMETFVPSQEDREIRQLLKDLHQPKSLFYWIDMIATALIGWIAFGFTLAQPRFSFTMLSTGALAVLALYRGLCFIHEISHLNTRALRGFEAVWNILFGYPLLMPSFIYVGVHQFHHKLTTYGTQADPEYLPFAKSAGMTVAFAAQSFLVPVLLMLRFLLLSPVGFLFPKFQEWLVIHASSLTMNIAYRRVLSDGLLKKIRVQTLVIWLLWMSVATFTWAGIVPGKFWVTWLVISGLASFINTLRTLGAHAYESSGQPLDREAQFRDSIDTPGAFWTELWAPVGLRYHALHHYFPGIPYHHLPEAYRRLVAQLEPSADYHQARSPSLPHSLNALLAKGFGQPR